MEFKFRYDAVKAADEVRFKLARLEAIIHEIDHYYCNHIDLNSQLQADGTTVGLASHLIASYVDTCCNGDELGQLHDFIMKLSHNDNNHIAFYINDILSIIARAYIGIQNTLYANYMARQIYPKNPFIMYGSTMNSSYLYSQDNHHELMNSMYAFMSMLFGVIYRNADEFFTNPTESSFLVNMFNALKVFDWAGAELEIDAWYDSIDHSFCHDFMLLESLDWDDDNISAAFDDHECYVQTFRKIHKAVSGELDCKDPISSDELNNSMTKTLIQIHYSRSLANFEPTHTYDEEDAEDDND